MLSRVWGFITQSDCSYQVIKYLGTQLELLVVLLEFVFSVVGAAAASHWVCHQENHFG